MASELGGATLAAVPADDRRLLEDRGGTSRPAAVFPRGSLAQEPVCLPVRASRQSEHAACPPLTLTDETETPFQPCGSVSSDSRVHL